MPTSFDKLTQVIEDVKQTLVTSLFQTFQVAAYDAGIRRDDDMISMKSADVVPEKLLGSLVYRNFVPRLDHVDTEKNVKNFIIPNVITLKIA